MENKIKVLRTDNDRFKDLPDYPFSPNYVDDLPGYEDIRIHYLDEGDKDSKEVFLCLHGEPSWSFLYRKMIPKFTEVGARVIAPDLIGFGKSDKPIEDEVYTFDFHRNYLIELIKRLDLQNITLVCQDWGGVLGLTIPNELKERFSRLLIMNTGLMLGPVNSPAFDEWKSFINKDPDVPVGEVMRRNQPGLSEEVINAYDAPFPSIEYKAGVRKFPNLIATSMETPGVKVSQEAANFWKNEWNGKTFMAIGMQDEMLGPGVMHFMKDMINGCNEPLEMPNSGHFVQEEGDIIAEKALEYFGLKKE